MQICCASQHQYYNHPIISDKKKILLNKYQNSKHSWEVYIQCNNTGTVARTEPVTFVNCWLIPHPITSMGRNMQFFMQSACYCCPVITITEIAWQFLVEVPNINFMKICSTLLESLHVYRRMDRQSSFNRWSEGLQICLKCVFLSSC